ncbi:MAG: DUF4012 domain-containing protein [Candidatus Gracilibacteria bacterium]|nr:DUF4012 domain-containing protein [Candidatus Gracilibacteria bacterium]
MSHEKEHENHGNYKEDHEKKHNHYDEEIKNEEYVEEEESEVEENDFLEEEKEIKKIIDLTLPEEQESKTLNLSEIFILSKAKPLKKIFKKNTLDLFAKLKDINLWVKPKIKILNLKRPISDLFKPKKLTFLNLNHNKLTIDEFSLNLLDIENIDRKDGPYSDIIQPKLNFNKLLKNTFSKKNKSKFKKNFSKTLIYIFVILIFIFSYGLLTKYKIQSTINHFKEIELQTDISNFKPKLIEIKSDLIICDFLLKPIFALNYFVNNETITNSKYGLDGVKFFINYAINTFVIYDGIDNLIKQKGPTDVMYSELIKNIEPNLLQAKNDINASVISFSKIKNLEGVDINKLFTQKFDLIKKINNYTNIFYGNLNIIKNLLGDQIKRNYLIVFQNSDEIRPTGGFMGSVGFVQVYKGKIINFEKKDIYALEWLIKDTFKQKSPDGLASITDYFSLRDANYFSDIGDSSNEIKYFLDKTDYKIDGIIYINQNFILDFLKNFGGIYFAETKNTINQDNFSMIMSTLVEAKITKTHTLATPKQILFDFIDLYSKELKKSGKYGLYINTILKSINKKDIIFYSFNKDENQFFSKLGFKKDIDFSSFMDFDYPVFASISGNKSDRYIQRDFKKEIIINNDCSINTKLIINQKHNFDINEETNIKTLLYDMDLLGKVDINATLAIEGKAKNKQYIRVYIPANAIIKENPNIKITQFNDKKEISFYLNTDVGSSSNFYLDYIIPNPTCKKYNYVFVKQPGIKQYGLNIINNGNLVIDSFLDNNYFIK